MVRILSILFVVITFSFVKESQAQTPSWLNASSTKKGSLEIYYYEQYPFVYKDDLGNLTGIEIDILNEFIVFLKEKKGVEVTLSFKPFTEFEKFYTSVRSVSEGVIGLGSVSLSAERMKEVTFSAPYLKNQLLLVTALNTPRIGSYGKFAEVLEGKTALVMNGTSHEKELLSIKEKHFPKMRVEYVSNQDDILSRIAEDDSFYGYVDLLSFWSFLAKEEAMLKIQREVSRGEDKIGFILPKGSDWSKPLAEFFESGFGFTATKKYRDILENYLGYEVIESVELY